MTCRIPPWLLRRAKDIEQDATMQYTLKSIETSDNFGAGGELRPNARNYTLDFNVWWELIKFLKYIVVKARIPKMDVRFPFLKLIGPWYSDMKYRWTPTSLQWARDNIYGTTDAFQEKYQNGIWSYIHAFTFPFQNAEYGHQCMYIWRSNHVQRLENSKNAGTIIWKANLLDNHLVKVCHYVKLKDKPMDNIQITRWPNHPTYPPEPIYSEIKTANILFLSSLVAFGTKIMQYEIYLRKNLNRFAASKYRLATPKII